MAVWAEPKGEGGCADTRGPVLARVQNRGQLILPRVDTERVSYFAETLPVGLG